MAGFAMAKDGVSIKEIVQTLKLMDILGILREVM